MLYIVQTSILLIWLIYIIKKEKYKSHVILNAQFFMVMFADIPESIFGYLLGYYKFSTHFTNNSRIINSLGLLICDGFTLPFTGIVLLHLAVKLKKPWTLSLMFTFLYGLLESIYVKFGYLTYHKWSIWISLVLYFVFSRILISFAPRIMLYKPPMPFSIRIATATYGITIYTGALISQLHLYQWRPLLVPHQGDDDRVFSVSISIVLALLSGLIIPKIKPKLRPAAFIAFSIIVMAFYYFAFRQGFLIYHKWNHFLTAVYWLACFVALIWYDSWEAKFEKPS